LNYNTPPEVAKITVDSGTKKASSNTAQTLLLGFLAGAYVAFAGHVSVVITHDTTQFLGFGMTKLINGIVFSVGLMLVVLAGGELFTGNALMVMGYMEGKFSLKRMFRNWTLVYASNLVGSLTVVGLLWMAGSFAGHNGLIGAQVVKNAWAKVEPGFWPLLARGILCNWLVCLGVWVGSAAQEVAGKVLSILFVITAFVASGFEHSIANMYTLPAALFLQGDPGVVTALAGARATVPLNMLAIAHNLLPVTIGNIIGGSVLVGWMYSTAYRHPTLGIVTPRPIQPQRKAAL
jgi:formate/nitrite transporter